MATVNASLKWAILALAFVGLAAVVFVFSGSLQPSEKAKALNSQFRFPVALLEDLGPGEVRWGIAGGAPMLVVAPDGRVDASIAAATEFAHYPEITTFDETVGAYVLWGISPKARGSNCLLYPTHQDGHTLWFADNVPEGFFDPCSGDRFDYAGRILVDANGRNVGNLRKPEYKRVASDEYQITNVSFLMTGTHQ